MPENSNENHPDRIDRPRIGVIGYGSLLQPSELATLAENAPNRAIPVKVDGLKRVFNQRTSWRTEDDIVCGVANVVRAADSWINGVLLPDLTRSEFRAFRERERWYRLIEISIDDVEPYDRTEHSRIKRLELILTTTGLETDPDIEPIPSYVDVCLNGAETWGEEFHSDFVESTETNAGSH